MIFDPSPDAALFSMDVRYDPGTATARMALVGEVDAVTAGQLQNGFIEAVRQHQPSRIDVDCEGVTFLDSAGIRTLVLCQADARQVDCHIILVNTSRAVYRVLEITGLLDHFGVKAGPQAISSGSD